MFDARIAIIVLGSIASLVGAAALVALFTGWLTGITVGTIFTEILRFIYKIWDTILSFFQTMVHAAPGMIKIIIFTALFWTVGNFLISSTIGVTNVCSEDGRLYNLGWAEGIGYTFLPDSFENLYYISASNDAYLTYSSGGFLGIGATTKYLTATANLVQSGEWFLTPKNMAEGTRNGLQTMLYGTTQSAWQSQGSSSFTPNTDPSYKDYPSKEFSICRRVNTQNSLYGASGDIYTEQEQATGECVFWEGSCTRLQLQMASQGMSFTTLWNMKYAVRYYQGSDGRELRYAFVNTGECGANSKITKLPFGGQIVWNCDTSLDAVDLSRCKINNSFNEGFTAPGDTGGAIVTVINGSNSDDYYDLNVAVFNGTVLLKNTSGRIYGTQKTPLRGAESNSGGLLGNSVVRTLFRSDGKSTLVDSKASFLAERDSTIPNKNKLVYFDCMKDTKEKYGAEIFIARLPIFSLKFIAIILAFTFIFAILGFLRKK